MVYVVAGPNGAGKTTFATEFLPEYVECREFLNADLIAAGLSPFNAESQNFRAGRVLLERIVELSRKRESFGLESKLSGRTYLKVLADLKAAGYLVRMHFLWLPDAQFAIDRVQQRVRHGGHSVDPIDITRRHLLGRLNWVQQYRHLADAWWLYDATELPPRLVAKQIDGTRLILDAKLYNKIESDE